MHVLYIIEANLSSGSGKCAIELLNLITLHTNIKPIVITQNKNSLNEECTKLGIENYALHYARTCSLGMGIIGWSIAFFARPLLNFISYQKLKSKINFKKIHLIHSNSSTIDFGAYLYHKTNIPHIWHIREFLVFERIHIPIIWNLPKYIENHCSSIITVSKSLKEFLLNKGVIDGHVFPVYDGVSIKDFKQREIKNNDQKLKLVCLGNYASIKGQDVVINAVSMLSKEDLSQITIDFYGTDNSNYKSILEAKCKKNHLGNSIHFYDFTDNVPELLKNYNIGLQPSHTEGFSRVTIEYMLAGLCPVGNGRTSISEQIINKKTGFLYHNEKEFASIISLCIHNREQISNIGISAQKYAKNHYSIEKNFQKILDIYYQHLNDSIQ